MSESTSCSGRARAALELVRQGGMPEAREIHALGEECAGDFFRIVIEALADSFDAAQSLAYDSLMAAWGLQRVDPPSCVPDDVETVYVLSRVTLGADIKITSLILDAMKQRFPEARIVFVAGRKSIELFEADPRLDFLEAAYPRNGPVRQRILFGQELRERLAGPKSIVVDPDSRMTQLGLIPLCDPSRHFHFPSRTEGTMSDNLSDLTNAWLQRTFGITGKAFIAPKPVGMKGGDVAISLGVGDNESKRVPGNFEASLIRLLARRFSTLLIDRGAGGSEAIRVTAAVEASGAKAQVQYWEGSFAGFTSLIQQSHFYAGYDSAGQHAAAAAGIPLVSLFAGAPSPVFRARWAPSGTAPITVIDTTDKDANDILRAVESGYPPLPFDPKQE